MAATCPSIIPLGRHDVRARLGLGQRDLPVELDGGVVEDFAVGPEEAAVPVVGVLIETEVGHQDELVVRRHRATPVGRAGRFHRDCTPRVPLASFVAGTPKRIRPGTPSETRRLASTTSDSRVCWNCPGMEAMGRAVDALAHEEGGDQVVDADARLGHQAAEGRGAAESSQPPNGKRAGTGPWRPA